MDFVRCGLCNVLLDFETWEFDGLCKKCYADFIFQKEYEERKKSCEENV